MTLLQIFRTPPARLPGTPSCTIVVDGRRVETVRGLPAARDDEELARRSEIRRELERARLRKRWQLDKNDPVKQALRAARYAANRERLLAYKRSYYERNRERVQVAKTRWQSLQRRIDPERHNEASRRYYAAHRDEILARRKAKRDAAKSAANPINHCEV